MSSKHIRAYEQIQAIANTEGYIAKTIEIWNTPIRKLSTNQVNSFSEVLNELIASEKANELLTKTHGK